MLLLLDFEEFVDQTIAGRQRLDCRCHLPFGITPVALTKNVDDTQRSANGRGE